MRSYQATMHRVNFHRQDDEMHKPTCFIRIPNCNKRSGLPARSSLHFQIRKSPWLKNKFREELGIDFEDYDNDWKTKQGQKMWDLNQLSLGYRYGDDKQEHVYRFSPVLCTPVQAYKAMQCWLYQCCEGEIPEESKLYKFFDEVVYKHVANSIISSMPEYENAEWG